MGSGKEHERRMMAIFVLLPLENPIPALILSKHVATVDLPKHGVKRSINSLLLVRSRIIPC